MINREPAFGDRSSARCDTGGVARSAGDYEWVLEWANGLLSVGYCVTFVRHRTPTDVLNQLHVAERVSLTGLASMGEPAGEAWSRNSSRGGFVGVTKLGDWSVIFELNGDLGTLPEVLVPLSTDTTVVSHYRNVNALDFFSWVEDGRFRLRFEPLFPTVRQGTDATTIDAILRGAGFDLSDSEDRDIIRHTAAAFALGEILTGVVLTPEMLESMALSCGIAPRP
jgi:hypothetical protein